MSSSRAGLILVGSEVELVGVITDGDIRAILSQTDSSQIFTVLASDFMSNNPKTVSHVCKCGDADALMKCEGINSLIVKENNVVLGIYNNLNRKKQ